MKLSGGQTWVKEAALIIVGVITPKKGTLKWKTVDVAIALQNIILMAEALGFSSCWVGYFKEKKLKELLNVPEDHSILAYITVGIKGEKPKERQYENINDLVFINSYKS
jgi:nitroreductase